MPRYQVKFYDGAYRRRQDGANADKAVVFVAQHLNAADDPSANYTLAIVPADAKADGPAYRLARQYAELCSRTFGAPLYGGDGVKRGGFDGRGDGQLDRCRMPAVLLEPLFVSNPEQAAIVRGGPGRQVLAEILADAIAETFPDGGLVAFSVGHAGKPAPHENDRGANVYAADGDEPLSEADVAADVLRRAQGVLEAL
jgi:N-acetylmuramoyl-L-alanine amidase